MDGTLSAESPIVELLTSFVSQADRGACRVAAFLDEAGILRKSNVGPPVHLPAEFLLGLDLALRFAHWELCGYAFHLSAGLPTGQALLDEVLELRYGPALESRVRKISSATIELMARHLIWVASADMQADIAIEIEDNEESLDAIADFIWSMRHRVPSGPK